MVVGQDGERFRCSAIVVLDRQVGSGRHQHVAYAAPLVGGRLMQCRLTSANRTKTWVSSNYERDSHYIELYLEGI